MSITQNLWSFIAKPKPENADYTYQVNSRDDFIDVFTALSAALPAPYIDQMPFVFVTGGLSSGKSLAAEAFVKTMTDGYTPDAVKKALSSNKFFNEQSIGGASINAVRHGFQSNGKYTSFIFRSAVSLEHSNATLLRDGFDQAANTARNVIFYTGFCNFDRAIRITNKMPNKPCLIIDIGREAFSATTKRVIRIAVTDSHLKKSTHFQSQMEAISHLKAPLFSSQNRFHTHSRKPS